MHCAAYFALASTRFFSAYCQATTPAQIAAPIRSDAMPGTTMHRPPAAARMR